MKKFFKLEENKTTVKTEIIAGITTFLAMAYILAVNPMYIGGNGTPDFPGVPGANPASIFMATAISASIATICMAFFANFPVALASGMGLNAFFTFTVCLKMGYPYEVALTAILVEGLIFMVMSLFKFRESLVNKIPTNLKFGITAGIGLFITIIALFNSNVIVANPSTKIALGDLSSASVVLSILGLLIIGVLQYKKVPGGILLGILITWGLGMIAESIGWYKGLSVFPDFSAIGDSFAAPAMFNFDFEYIFEHFASFAIVVFTFLYTDIFDTVGTLIGVTQKAGIMKQDGTLPRAGGALMADAVGTVAGACLGTSTVTSYVESSAGVAAGGKTGLTALTTGIMFLIAIPFAPIFLAIPGFATTPAMLYVGILMLSAIKNMDFDGDIADVIGGFMAVVMMPFAYSIATGIMFGILSWVILKVLIGKIKDVSAIMWISFLLFVAYILTLVL